MWLERKNRLIEKDYFLHTRSGVLSIRYFEGDDVLEIFDGETIIFS
jgi:hypothetical protein